MYICTYICVCDHYFLLYYQMSKSYLIYTTFCIEYLMRLHNELPDYNKSQFKKVCHDNCYTQTPIIPHGRIKDIMSKRMTTSHKRSNPMGDTSFYKSCSRSFSLILYLLNIVLYNIV